MQLISLGQLQFQKKSKRKAGDGNSSGTFRFFTSSQQQSKWLEEADFMGPALIFGTGGSASAHYCDESFSSSTDCFILKSDRDDIDMKYLYYFLRTNISILENGFKGAGLKHISKEYLSEINIPLPSLEEQKSIVTKLDKLIDLIDLKKQAIGKTEELTKSVFLEMFGDPIENPKGWELGTFGDGISVLTDYHANGSYEILRDNVTLLSEPEYAYVVRTTDLENQEFTNGVKYIDEHAYNFLSKTKIYGGEIIINKIGSAGEVYLMPFLERKASLGMNAFLIRTKPDTLIELFAYFYLKNPSIKKLIESKVLGAVTKTITKDAVRSIKFYFPPYSLQQKFIEITKINQVILDNQNQSLQKLQELYNTTTQELFSF